MVTIQPCGGKRQKDAITGAITCLSVFAPQTQYTINVVMRYEAYSTWTASYDPSSWKSFATKRSPLPILSSTEVDLWGRPLKMWHSAVLVVDSCPRYIAHGNKVVLVVDYRVFFKQNLLYKFYLRVAEKLASKIAAEGYEGWEDRPRLGLIGVGPGGLYPRPTQSVIEVLKRVASETRLLSADSLSSYLTEALAYSAQDTRITVYITYPSLAEYKVFKPSLEKSASKTKNVEHVGSIDSYWIGELLSRESASSIIIVTPDPLPYMYPPEGLRGAEPWSIVVVHYLGLYFNLAAEYYTKLHSIVKSVKNGNDANETSERYLREAGLIPLLALGVRDDVNVNLPTVDWQDTLPLMIEDKKLLINGIDIALTSHRGTAKLLKLLPKRILPELNIELGQPADEDQWIRDVKRELKRQAVMYILEQSFSEAASRRRGRSIRRLFLGERVHRASYSIDDLRRD